MLVRSKGLAASMSKYLIDRIAATPNIELRTQTEISELEGAGEAGLESVTFRNHKTGEAEKRPARHVFLFLGAEPSVDWLQGCGVMTDAKGFVCTGTHVDSSPDRQALETSLEGVFAIGDVRASSVKRDRKSTRLNSSHLSVSRMPSSA